MGIDEALGWLDSAFLHSSCTTWQPSCVCALPCCRPRQRGCDLQPAAGRGLCGRAASSGAAGQRAAGWAAAGGDSGNERGGSGRGRGRGAGRRSEAFGRPGCRGGPGKPPSCRAVSACAPWLARGGTALPPCLPYPQPCWPTHTPLHCRCRCPASLWACPPITSSPCQRHPATCPASTACGTGSAPRQTVSWRRRAVWAP